MVSSEIQLFLVGSNENFSCWSSSINQTAEEKINLIGDEMKWSAGAKFNLKRFAVFSLYTGF